MESRTLLAFFIMTFALLTVPTIATTCDVRVDDIILEERGGVDPHYFCSGDLIRVGADISVFGDVDPAVSVRLYVDGRFYESEVVDIAPGDSARVYFDRYIDASDFIPGDPEVRVTAEAFCDPSVSERTEFFYVNSCPRYNSLYFTVKDCDTGRLINAAKVDVDGRVSYTRYSSGTVSFYLNSGTYSVEISAPNYKSKSFDVYIPSYRTVSQEVCLSRYPLCSAGYVDEYRCEGNYRQQKYRSEDCGLSWKIADYCYYGCFAGQCRPELGVPSVELDSQYEVEACKVSGISFKVSNEGETRSSFGIETSGSAADWVAIPKKTTLAKDETDIITGLINVPCDVEAGNYDFTVSLTNSFSDSDSSFVTIKEQRIEFDPTGLVVVFFVVLLAIGIGYVAVRVAYMMPFRRQKPESF